MSSRGAEGTPSGVPTFTTAGEEQQSKTDSLLEYQKEYADEWFALCAAIQKETQRAIITAIYDGMGSCTYDEIEKYASVSRRSIRNNVQTLEEKNVVKRVNSRSYAISFTQFEVEALAEHAIDCYLG